MLPWNLHIKVWSCVWIGNSNKSTFLHQRHLEYWDRHDVASFPALYPINCQKSCIFLFPLQIVHPLHYWEECWEAHCNPNVHCSTQYRASFLYTTLLALWVCTILEGKMGISWTFPSLELSDFKRTILSAISISCTMQDILLQNSTELKLKARKNLT